MLNSEFLPRRNSLQFYPIKKKKISNILDWINLEKNNKKIVDLKFEFLLNQNKLNFIKKIQITTPFQKRINKKTFYIILSNYYRKFKESLSAFLKLKIIGKITNLNQFLQKIKKKPANKSKPYSSQSFLIDNTVNEIEAKTITGILKKKKTFFYKINLKNKISIEIVKVLSINNYSNNNATIFPIIISKNFCLKSLHQNIFNLIGGTFEKLYLGPSIISKIFIKTQLLPNLSVYIKE